MKKLSAALLSAGAAVSILVGVAFAQTAAPAAPNPAPPHAQTQTQTPAPVDRKALAKECSKQADAKGLRGKPRKRFRDACKRGQTGETPKPVS
ncbi:MAG: phosphate starvation-inducible protein PsiF [Methylocystis sp.]